MKPIGSSAIFLLLLLAATPPGVAQEKPARDFGVKVRATTTARAQSSTVLPGIFGNSQCPPPPLHECPSPDGARVLITEDGSVQTTYTDGTVRLSRSDGGKLITYSDGTSVEDTRSGTTWRDRAGKVTNYAVKLGIRMDMPFAGPPDPPASGSQLYNWLLRHNQDLLMALTSRLGAEAGGAKSLRGYLAKEQELGLYDQIAARTALLERLLQP
jgi:hypothetical protein